MPSSPSSVTCGSATKVSPGATSSGLHEGEPALDPGARRTRSALKLVHLSVHDARGEQQDRIVRRGRERLGPFRHRKRLGILRTQAKDESEPVQQAPAHRMLRDVAKQRVRTLEGALRFGADAEHMEGRHAAKRCERDLERAALRPLGRLMEKVKPRSVRLMHSAGLQVQERGFGSLGVVAQRGHRLAAALEVHRELRGGDRHARGTLPFERRTDFAVELRAGRCGPCARTAPGGRARA